MAVEKTYLIKRVIGVTAHNVRWRDEQKKATFQIQKNMTIKGKTFRTMNVHIIYLRLKMA